ncbi:MAG: hypothetical protein ACKVLN_13010, partial [Rhodobacterales bacterium]
SQPAEINQLVLNRALRNIALHPSADPVQSGGIKSLSFGCNGFHGACHLAHNEAGALDGVPDC